MTITAGDLHDIPDANTFIYCEGCDLRSSASRGDYWYTPDEEKFICGECAGELVLARETCNIEVILR